MISHGINLQLAQVTETLEICHTELTRSKEKLKTFRCKEDADEFLVTEHFLLSQIVWKKK